MHVNDCDEHLYPKLSYIKTTKSKNNNRNSTIKTSWQNPLFFSIFLKLLKVRVKVTVHQVLFAKGNTDRKHTSMSTLFYGTIFLHGQLCDRQYTTYEQLYSSQSQEKSHTFIICILIRHTDLPELIYVYVLIEFILAKQHQET